MKLYCIDCGKKVERIRKVKSVCFSCQRKRYVNKKPGIIKECRERYYHKNRDKILLKCKDYYFQNKEKIIEYAKKQRKLRKKDINKRRRELYNSINKEKVILQTKKYYQNNKNKIAQKGKIYRKNNKEKILIRNRNRKSKIRALQTNSDITIEWLQKLLKNTFECPLCFKVLEEQEKHIDHIIPININGEHKKDNIRITCRKCNLSRSKDGRDNNYTNEKAIKIK